MSWLNVSESRARNIDTYCKVIGTVALFAAGMWTLTTYFNARDKEIQNATLEAQKPFLSERLDIYSKVLRVAYKIDDASSDRAGRENDPSKCADKTTRGQST